MKTLVLVFHPDLTVSRLNRRWVEEIGKQETVTVRRMYEIYPDEQIDVPAEQTLLEQHDRIVLQFPFYWYSTPPLLKKWQDAVLAHGWAHGSTGDKLHGKELMLAISVGAPEEAYTQGGAFGYRLDELLTPLRATSNLIGTRFLAPYAVYGASRLAEDRIEETAAAYADYVLNHREEAQPCP